MGKNEKYHKHTPSNPGMPDKITSVIQNPETGQRGEATGYEGGTKSFKDLDKIAYERMKEDKSKE